MYRRTVSKLEPVASAMARMVMPPEARSSRSAMPMVQASLGLTRVEYALLVMRRLRGQVLLWSRSDDRGAGTCVPSTTVRSS